MKIARLVKHCVVGFVCIAICCMAMLPFAARQTARAYDSFFKDADGFDDSIFMSLDYGLYWYDNDSVVPKKAGTTGANFDPNRPTIIFTHGMKTDEGYKCRDLVSLWGLTPSQFKAKGYEPYMYYDQYYQVLLDMGYNVGHFYWNQLAEIGITGDKRIWSSDAGNMDYFVLDANGNKIKGDTNYNPTTSIACLFRDAIKSALGANYNQPLRLVGHSMGGQLVLATTQGLVHQYERGLIGANMIPERVSLIDPYLSNSEMPEGATIDHLDHASVKAGTWTAELCANALEDIADYGVAVDGYGGTQMVYRNYFAVNAIYAELEEDEVAKAKIVDRYSTLTERLGRAACWTHLDALQARYGAICHCMIIDYYFTTMYEEAQTDNFGLELPSVTSSTEYIRSIRGANFVQQVREGSKENPFYRHTTDFVRTDAFIEPIETTEEGGHLGTLYLDGINDGTNRYTSALLYDATSAATVAEAQISGNGELHMACVPEGQYLLRLYGDRKMVSGLVEVKGALTSLHLASWLALDDVDAVATATTGCIVGETKDYAEVELINADTMEVLTHSQIAQDGQYSFLNVPEGSYYVKLYSANSTALVPVIVTSTAGTDIAAVNMSKAEVTRMLPQTATFVILVLIPVVAVIVMVVVILLAMRAVKRAKA